MRLEILKKYRYGRNLLINYFSRLRREFNREVRPDVPRAMLTVSSRLIVVDIPATNHIAHFDLHNVVISYT